MRSMPITMILLAGCAYPDPPCASGYERDASGECQALSQDTGDAPIEGSFTGPLSIDIAADVEGVGVIEDTCEGSVGLERETQALSGDISCSFSGTVSGFIGEDPFVGTLSGTVDDNGGAGGPLSLDLGTFGLLEADWTGTATDEDLDGSFTGEMVFDLSETLVVPVDFTGSFSASASD